MIKRVDISNIYSLKGFINSRGQRDSIREYFKKKTHRSEINNYRPESEPWYVAKEKDNVIANLPDHDVKINYDELSIEYNYNELRFTIGTITTKESSHWSEDDDYEDIDVTRTFLVENSYWGTGLITSFEELINHEEVQKFLESMLGDQRRDKWRDKLQTYCDGEFMLLLDKVIKSEKNGLKIDFWINDKDRWVQIGEQKYHLKDMIEINKAYKSDSYEFYDENDKKIIYSEYYHDSFPDFYLKYSSEKINLAD